MPSFSGEGYTSVLVVSKAWCDSVVEESSVLHQLCIADLVFNSASFALDGVLHFERFARLHRWFDAIGAEEKILIVFFQLATGNRDLRIEIGTDVDVKTIDGLLALVGDRLDGLHLEIARLRKDIDLVLDRLDLGLRHSCES